MRKLITKVFSLLLLLACVEVQGQERPSNMSGDAGPRVGVALSGGGAKGAAHIGVLKYLVEQGIPIDYITGTSMGSIVGGLYALGYSVEDLHTLLYKRCKITYFPTETQQSVVSFIIY